MTIRCDFCNRFMSYRQMYSEIRWTPFGSGEMQEQPDEQFIHRRCWKKATHEERFSIAVIAWLADDTVRKEGWPQHLVERAKSERGEILKEAKL